jgi:hypothetical protein
MKISKKQNREHAMTLRRRTEYCTEYINFAKRRHCAGRPEAGVFCKTSLQNFFARNSPIQTRIGINT